MGAVTDWLIQKHEEEMGNSELSWSKTKTVLKCLMQEFPDTVTWMIQDAIEKREGSGPCDVSWFAIRQMMNNLTEIYYSDLSLSDLYGQIAHMSDSYDSLSDKVEESREHAEFQRLLDKDD